MSQLTVHELLFKKKGLASKDQILVGILSTVVNERADHRKRGSLLLTDPKTLEEVHCRVDRFHPRAIGIPIHIKQWNYIYEPKNGRKILEFSLDQVYTPDSELSVLRQGIAADIEDFYEWMVETDKLENTEKLDGMIDTDEFSMMMDMDEPTHCKLFYTPSSHFNLVNDEFINVVGVIRSVSVLYDRPGIQASFFIELANAEETSSIALYFDGNDYIKYHSYFKFGGCYTFSNLLFQKLNSGIHSYGVLQFGPSSCTQQITNSMYKNDITIASTTNHTLDLTVSHIANKKCTYTGVITRVIDDNLGIYEIDHQMLLCLYHYLVFTDNKLYRTGTKIRVSHYHTAKIHTSSTSHLMEKLWKISKKDKHEPYIALVGCPKTCIEILSFPSTCDTGIPYLKNELLASIKYDLALYILHHHLSFTSLLRLLEIYTTLVYRFTENVMHMDELKMTRRDFMIALERMVQHVFRTTLTPLQRPHGDMGVDFFRHDLACSAMGALEGVEGTTVNVTLDAFPSLNVCVDDLITKATPYDLNLAGANYAFEADMVKVMATKFTKTHRHFILGIVCVDNKGRLRLVDEESSHAIHIKGHVQPGGLYLLQRGQLFREDLSYLVELEKHDLDCTFFGCEAQDLVPVYTVDMPVFYMQEKIGPTSGEFFFSSHQGQLYHYGQYVLAQVLNKFPITCSFTRKRLYLSSKIIVRLFPIGPQQSNRIRVDSSKEYDLNLTSLNDSLCFHSQMQVGGVYVIHGLDTCESKVGVPDSFIMDQGHKLYPVLDHPVEGAAVHISPMRDNVRPYQGALRTVLNIRDINQPDRIVNAGIGSDKEIVHLTGLVIVKKQDSKRDVALLDPYAKQLYTDLGVGTGNPKGKITIQLRETNLLEMVTIYMDPSMILYPVGLVVGARVIFRNLTRNLNRNAFGNDAFHANTQTEIEVINTLPDIDVHQIYNELATRQNIAWFANKQSAGLSIGGPMYRVYCSMTSIINIQLKWLCQNCQNEITKGHCYRMCIGASRRFVASAFIEVRDNLACANVNLDGEKLVFQLLQLQDLQAVEIKERTFEGPFIYSDFHSTAKKAMTSPSLRKLVTKAHARPFWLLAKVQDTKRYHEVLEFQEGDTYENELRSCDISDAGGILRGFQSNKVKFKAFDIEYVNPVFIGDDALKQRN